MSEPQLNYRGGLVEVTGDDDYRDWQAPDDWAAAVKRWRELLGQYTAGLQREVDAGPPYAIQHFVGLVRYYAAKIAVGERHLANPAEDIESLKRTAEMGF